MGAFRDRSSGLSSVLLVALALLLPTTARPVGTELADLTYDRETDQLSVATQAMPAGDLLRQIAQLAGIRFRVHGELGEVPAQAFTDLSLDEAILRLFRSTERGLSVFYETLPGNGERVAEVRLSARAPAGPRVAKVVSVDEAEVGPKQGTGQAHVVLPPPPRLPPPPPPWASFR